MKTLRRLFMILLVALAVIGVTYAISQSTWATTLFAAAPHGEHGAGRGSGEVTSPASLAGAAATLGVTAEALSAALDGMPPDYAQAAQTLGQSEPEVRAAVETRLASRSGQRPDGDGTAHAAGGDDPSGGFEAAALTNFVRILLPIGLMIGAVALIRGGVERARRARTRSSPTPSAS